jgi:hypothetical protein
MLKGLPKVGRLWLLLLGAAWLAACGSSPPPAKTAAVHSLKPAPAVTVATPAPSPEPAAPPQTPAEPPGFDEALASLRPAASEPQLQALISAPTDPEAYAQAALAYASTEVPGMTLLWGLSYQAMGGGSSDAAVAGAVSKVLTERILAKPGEQQQVTFNLRLAPGRMPMRKSADGAVEAPLAHTFEALFGPAVTTFQPPWTIEQFYDVLSSWTGVVAAHGTALDPNVEVDGWLVTAAKARHLEAFCYQLLGPAFPVELKAYKAKNAASLKAYRVFVKGAPLRPKRAPLPDDLVRIE